MRSLNIKLKYIAILILILSLQLMIGCQDVAPNQSFNRSDNTSIDEIEGKSKKKKIDFRFVLEPDQDRLDLSQSVSGIVTYQKNKKSYRGLTLQHPSGSSLVILPGSLTPPDDVPWGDPVTITMTVEKDTLNNELIYTFGQSGCEFWLPATLWLSWKELDCEQAELYYIEKDGTYVPQNFDGINIVDRVYVLAITHFSRYALAYSN